MIALLEKITVEPTPHQIQQIEMIALLSLLEGLMNVPLDNLLQILHPNQEIEDALLTHTGMLGRIYAATLKLEIGDINSAAILLKNFGISPDNLH